MTYKNKLVFLLSLISALSLIYIAGIIFSPDRRNERSSSHVWLDQKLTGKISRITLDSYEQKFELFKKENEQWFVLFSGNEYLARQMRVEDFIGIFTTRAPWIVRSSNVSSHSRFGLDESAARLIIYGEDTVFLDLLLGFADDAGMEIYVRKYGENEVRSGENRISSYLTGYVSAWFDLKLFQGNEDGYFDVNDVQRLSVYNNGESQIFSRVNRMWELTVSDSEAISGFNNVNPEQGIVESYIRNVLNSEGDDIVNTGFPISIDLSYSRIIVEFSNGKISTIRFSEPDADDHRFARIDGSDSLYSIPSWVSSRLFRMASSFVMQ